MPKGSALFFPLDGTANRGRLLGRRSAAAGNVAHCFDQLAASTRSRRSRAPFIEPAAVFQSAVAIKAEEIRRAHGIIGARHRLVLIMQIWKGKVMSAGEMLHVVEGIFGIGRGIV